MSACNQHLAWLFEIYQSSFLKKIVRSLFHKNVVILRLNLVLTYGIPPEFRGGVHYETAIRHRVSPEFIGSRNCVPMAFTAESPPAKGK